MVLCKWHTEHDWLVNVLVSENHRHGFWKRGFSFSILKNTVPQTIITQVLIPYSF